MISCVIGIKVLLIFLTTITNVFTEGCNNKIKVLIRNRILHIFSHQQLKTQQAAA